jgi:cytochrome c oxidase cbb3-type subunit 3
MTPTDRPSVPAEPAVRPHIYDGIREYDQRLPNWWLLTFYGAIVFAVAYWSLAQHFRAPTDGERVTAELARVEAAKLASIDTSKLDDAALWQMSRNPVFLEPGKATYQTLCVSCHLASLKGKHENPAAIGPDLTDDRWIHGGRPLELYHTVTAGVPAKGMITWGPILGPKKITEVVAFILSHHDPKETPVQEESTAPATGVPAPAAP